MASPTSAVKTAALPLDTTIPPTPSSSTPTSANPTEPRVLHNDPARTGFDPQTKWWVNYFNILTGNMTREGQFHYREHRYRVNEERDIRRVEADRDWLFAYSPTIRFMREKIESLNGTLDETNVVCRRCPARLTEDGEVHRQSGGFSPAHGILICANEMRDRKHLEDTLAHEMVHAWDHLRWQVDWLGDMELKHAACTEDCVRSRAIQSVMNRPRCKDDVQATKVVNQVWDSCFADTRPFDEIYR
ncbi:hypothetical protein ACHAPS_007334 [Verticillium nonalfalfae]